jgi:hypothetical protein
MRYLRMLTNALVGGLMGAAFVTVLVLQLNRHLPLDAWTLLTLYGRLALFYAPHLAVGFYGLLVLRELVGRRPTSGHWVSLRVLSWQGSIVVSAAAALMWLNYAGFAVVLDADSGRRLAAAAGATTLCALLLTVVTVVHYSFGRRGSRVGTTLLVLTLAASLLFPIAARGWGERRRLAARALDFSGADPAVPDGPRVTLVAVDGASLDYIAQAVSGGRLPNLGRVLEGGASMHLSTIRPTQPAPVWTTVATGKYPSQTGVRAAAAYSYAADREPIELLPDLCFSHALVHLGILRESPWRSAGVRARPLWAILGAQQLSSGVVSWPVTSPAPPMRGFLITDRFARSMPSGRRQDDVDLGSPEAAVLRARAMPTRERSRCSSATSTGPVSWYCATKASIAPATCFCAMRGRASSAVCLKRSAGSTAACSIGTTRFSMPRSRSCSRRSARRICCWWSPDLGWSRSASPSACWRAS